jgi:hypothetical protein
MTFTAYRPTAKLFWVAFIRYYDPLPTAELNTSKNIEYVSVQQQKILRVFGPLVNYADRATAAPWRSSTNFCG